MFVKTIRNFVDNLDDNSKVYRFLVVIEIVLIVSTLILNVTIQNSKSPKITEIQSEFNEVPVNQFLDH